MRDFFKYRCKRGENNEAWIISFFLERDGIFAVFAAFNLSASFIGINHWLFWDQASTYLILESLIYKKLDQERYITREECIEWCGNSWLPSIDDSAAIKKKNYTGRFFHDKFSETVMVSTVEIRLVRRSPAGYQSLPIKFGFLSLKTVWRTPNISRKGRIWFQRRKMVWRKSFIWQNRSSYFILVAGRIK